MFAYDGARVAFELGGETLGGLSATQSYVYHAYIDAPLAVFSEYGGHPLGDSGSFAYYLQDRRYNVVALSSGSASDAPWQRGCNENTNGLLREFFPKGADFRQVTHARLARVQQMLNNRPRKCLNYRTPREVLNALPGVALQN